MFTAQEPHISHDIGNRIFVVTAIGAIVHRHVNSGAAPPTRHARVIVATLTSIDHTSTFEQSAVCSVVASQWQPQAQESCPSTTTRCCKKSARRVVCRVATRVWKSIQANRPDRVDEILVERRCLGQTELKVKPGQVNTSNATKADNLGVLDYAHLRVSLPKDLSGSGIFTKQKNGKWPESYFLMVLCSVQSSRSESD